MSETKSLSVGDLVLDMVVPFSDGTGAASEADPNGVCHLKTADGKSQTGNFKECPA